MPSSPVRDESGQEPRAGGVLPPGISRMLPTLLPLGLLVLSLILPGYMFESDQRPSAIGLGPAAWPRTMLHGLAVFSALWIVRDIWVLGRAGRGPTLRIPKDEEQYDFGKALGGLVMIVAYGWLLPVLGFAVSTTIFIATWCLFSGLRNLMIVVPVTLIATISLLWLFMGLALMPLPRGAGMFGEFSIWLLRATGIY